MATYITLYTFTDQGVREMKSLPERVRAARANAEERGFKILGWYLTQGQYDVVTIVDVPDEKTLAAGTLAIASNGNFRTQTLRAFNEGETEQIIRQMG